MLTEVTAQYIDRSTQFINPNNTKTVQHGEWTFEYNSKSNIYDSLDIESYDTKRFNHHIQHDTTETYNPMPYTKDDTKLTENDLEDFRKAALIHKIARKKALSMLYAGGKLADLVDAVENIILRLCKQDLKTYYSKGSDGDNSAGIAFPVGVNINNVVAHDSKISLLNSNREDLRKFYSGDVVKIDIGVHVNGRIIDSAFTHIVTDQPGIHDKENIYNSVLEASRDSVFNAIKMAGPDQRLDEMSESISEIINSYEVSMGSETLSIKPIKGIGGHNIKHYQIHGNKLILSEPDYEIQGDQRMEEDEIYAIETYASTGYGVMTQNSEIDRCTHYMESNHHEIDENHAITKKDKKFFRQTDLYQWLQTRKGLPFSSSWLSKIASEGTPVPKIEKAFKLGIPSGQLMAYPPLFDEENSVVAQFEHTIHVNDRSVEIFSLGEDY